MCSSSGGCAGNVTDFGNASQLSIGNHRNSRGCLTDGIDRHTYPVFDDFESGLDPLLWFYNNGGSVSTNGVNEPSGSNALELDASGSAQYRDDDIRTNEIDLGGAVSGNVSLWVQHRGVENGEQVKFEYWSSGKRWIELGRITSDGNDQNSFVFQNYAIPGDGLQVKFRFRGKSKVNASNDNWLIDDFSVTASATLSMEMGEEEDGGAAGRGPGAGTRAGHLQLTGGLPGDGVLFYVGTEGLKKRMFDPDPSTGFDLKGPLVRLGATAVGADGVATFDLNLHCTLPRHELAVQALIIRGSHIEKSVPVLVQLER
jgi:hypothetical protein